MAQVKVLHFLSSYSIGITGILVDLACTMVRMGPEAFVFVGGEKEQFSGLFRKLDENHVPYHVIQGLDDHKQFKRLVREFTDLVHEIKPEYVHVQTNLQLAMVWLARV